MSAFVTTRWSIVARAGLEDKDCRHEALEALCRCYWKPVFVFVRNSGLDEETAKDVTQAFFEKVLKANSLPAADPERGRFRTFLLTLLKRFIADWRDHGRALKRGGGVTHVSLDWIDAPVLVDGGATPEEAFDRRWATTVMERVAAALRTEVAAAGREELFSMLAPFLTSDPDPGDYARIGETLGLSRGAISMAVHRLRARFRDLLRKEVAETLSDSSDLEAEMDALREVLRG
ncbi:MAG: hypothetical protein JWL81_2434 [Verrucomicrobiales bacterium]|nr:hypothetical protein [Verrucomicrobiales bacterium]